MVVGGNAQPIQMTENE